MLEGLSTLDCFFWDRNPSLEFGRIDVEILSELRALKMKKLRNNSFLKLNVFSFFKLINNLLF